MLKLYNANETNFSHNGLGILRDTITAKVVEELNGIFELEFTYPVNFFLYEKLDYDMIVKADASTNLIGQLFRIYYISKVLDGKITIKAQHISYDLFDNFVEKVELENVTCEYALNQIFSSCTQANRFKGYSDIVNTQSYSIECVNPYEAIKGVKGSIVDTFGLGAKLKRDNFDIHVLNVRGESNNVLIAYKKNITGFEASIDIQDVVTKIYPYAFIDVEIEGESTSKQVKITLPEKYVTSVNVDKYANEKIIPVDFSGDDVKTETQLRVKANKFFQNKKDIPSTNYKVEFIELSKTENYKDYKMLETVNLDDEVIVRLLKFGVNATTRVVKTEYNPIQKRYIAIELGQLVNHFKNDNDRLNKIEDSIGDIRNNVENIDTNVDDTKFPNTLPIVPTVTANGLFATVQLEWTYEGKSYYNYEIYSSQIQQFTADTINYTNRIFTGKASAFLHEVKPMQTWYYKIRAGNTHGGYTDFSLEVSATTRKLSNAAEYMEEACIDKALIGSLDVDKVVAGKIKGTYIDAKDLSVIDGNGDITFKVDSFGNVYIKATNFSLQGKGVDTIAGEVAQTKVDAMKTTIDGEITNTSNSLKDYADDAVANQTQSDIFNILTNYGVTQGIYLYNGKIYINGTYIQAGTIATDMLSTPSGHQPIIKLFPNGAEYCSIDATALNETGGFGNAIRMKLDSDNYVKVRAGSVDIYTNGYSGHEIFSFSGSSGYAKINSQGGTLELGSGVSYNGSKLAYSSHTHSNYASNSHNHSGEYLSPYNISPSTLGNGGSILMHDSLDGNGKNLGYSGSRFNQVSAKNGYFDYATGSSDIDKKENIKFITNRQENVLKLNENTLVANERDFTTDDFYNFVKEQLNLASYNYIRENNELSETDYQLGFIANDVVMTDVGSKFVYYDEEGKNLNYSMSGYTTVIAGALQKSITKIEELENRIAILEGRIQ